MKREAICGAIIVGIVSGILIDTWRIQNPSEIVYAQEPEPPQEVLIEVNIEWTKERIEQEIRKTFPENPNLAIAIAKAESELKATAYNGEAHRGCTGSYGIMQIACVHHKKNKEELYDVQLNLKKAREIYEAEGNTFIRWGAYTDGRYKKYYEKD